MGRGRDGASPPPHLESGGGQRPLLPPPLFLHIVFFYMRTPGIPNQKSQADADMQPITKSDIAFDLFNIFFICDRS